MYRKPCFIMDKLIYDCNDNDVEVKISFFNNKIDELQIGVKGMGEWTVLSYKDLKKAIDLAEKQLTGV